MDLVLLLARLALAAVFLVAGAAKLADLPGSRRAVAAFGVPERFAPTVGILLPLAEIAIAIALVPTSTAQWGALGALLLLLAFIAAISVNLAQGRTPDCHCFGQIHSAPAGPSTIVRNGVLAAIAASILVAGWGDPGASAGAWIADLSGIETVLLIGGVLVLGAIALLGWAVVNLMSQNGRLLTRLDALEAALATGKPVVPAASTPTAEQGLAVGAPAPAFSLPDLDGTPVTLDALRTPGVPLMLLFTDPGCGPCNGVLRQLNRWRETAGNRLDIAVVSRGTRDANLVKAREHGLARVLLQEGREVAQAYGALRTPSAVLVRPDGAIGTPLAGGAEAIQALVASFLAPGIAPSTVAAPAFQLPSLDGDLVTLASLQAAGLPVVLFFTDSTCDPCDLLLPEVARWQRKARDRMTVAVISRGSAVANRAKTEPYGIANVLLQSDLEVVNAYGLTQAPAVVVVRPNGTRAGSPAYGDPAIRSLVAQVANASEIRPAPVAVTASRPASLAVGEPVPSLLLPTIDGAQVDLAGPSSHDRVLLFWNPGCGFCQRMVSDIEAWEAHRAPDAPELVLVSAGNAEATRAHGLTSTVLLDDGQGVGRRFGAHGTPAAVRIDRAGRVASPVATGRDAVLGLLAPPVPAGANGHH